MADQDELMDQATKRLVDAVTGTADADADTVRQLADDWLDRALHSGGAR